MCGIYALRACRGRADDANMSPAKVAESGQIVLSHPMVPHVYMISAADGAMLSYYGAMLSHYGAMFSYYGPIISRHNGPLCIPEETMQTSKR